MPSSLAPATQKGIQEQFQWNTRVKSETDLKMWREELDTGFPGLQMKQFSLGNPGQVLRFL